MKDSTKFVREYKLHCTYKAPYTEFYKEHIFHFLHNLEKESNYLGDHVYQFKDKSCVRIDTDYKSYLNVVDF